jgi:hypothetical protein
MQAAARTSASRPCACAAQARCAPATAVVGRRPRVAGVARRSSVGTPARPHLQLLRAVPAPGVERPSAQVVVVLGTQWGDEGKGKLVDILAREFDIVARAQVRGICVFFFFLLFPP